MQVLSPSHLIGSTALGSAAVSQSVPGQKKRIALMLSGLPRQWRGSLQSQLLLFRNHQVDVFFHFWDTIDAAEKDEIVALLQPRAYVFEPPRDFLAEDTNPLYQRDTINMPSRLFSQYYSWREVANLMEPHKADYDFAMRSRSDLNFVRDLEPALKYLQPNDILAPWCQDHTNIIPDLFAFGAVNAILHYHKIMDYLQKLASQCCFNPEVLLRAHLDTYPNIQTLTTEERYFFVRRPHMTTYSAEQALREDPGLNKWLDPEQATSFRELHRRLNGDAGARHVEAFRYAQGQRLVVEVAQKIVEAMVAAGGEAA